MNSARKMFCGQKCKSVINNDAHNTLLTCVPVRLYLVLYIVVSTKRIKGHLYFRYTTTALVCLSVSVIDHIHMYSFIIMPTCFCMQLVIRDHLS